MLGQLWVVDEPEPEDGFEVEPEPEDGFEVAAGVGEAVLAASAGPARASAAPAPAPITGTAAKSQSLLLSRIDVTSFVLDSPCRRGCAAIMEDLHEKSLGTACEIGVRAWDNP
jgi:hypothetical protein